MKNKEYIYIIELKSGPFSSAKNGLELDHLIGERWKDVKEIKVVLASEKEKAYDQIIAKRRSRPKKRPHWGIM